MDMRAAYETLHDEALRAILGVFWKINLRDTSTIQCRKQDRSVGSILKVFGPAGLIDPDKQYRDRDLIT